MPRNEDDMDLGGIPGMPAPAPAPAAPARSRREPVRRAPVIAAGLPGGDVAAETHARRGAPANGHVEFPTRNPYAGDKRVAMNHRVYESLPEALAQLSAALEAAGYSPRQCSQAELLQMILHFSTPRSVEEAAPLLQMWAMVKAAPPAREDR